jgi:NAD(P)-dependent dehydrogenase (short-subunit alcohol dehydrogenase family)
LASAQITFMSSSLQGKVALVTGGSGTIGKAIAKAFLSEGAIAILAARGLPKLEEAKQELIEQGANGNNIHVITSDIAKEDNVMNLFAQIDAKSLGAGGNGVDIVINNAGINVAKATPDLTGAELESVLGVNVVGAFLCAREAMKRMVTGGRIINIGSISASSPRPNSTAYTTSKFALNGLTQSLALDGRPKNIAVGIIHPGNVVSNMLSAEDIKKRGKTEGFLKAEDVAQCVLTMATLPYAANVLELTVIPTTQPFIGRG